MRRILGLALAIGTSMALAQGMGPGGMGKGDGKGPGMRFGAGNTSGWSMMTPEERNAHHAQMMNMKTYEECKAYQAAHHAQMQARAKDSGRPMPAVPNENMCDRMKSAGRLK